MTPSEVLGSVFVHNRHGYLIETDERRQPQDKLRDLPATAFILGQLIRPTAA